MPNRQLILSFTILALLLALAYFIVSLMLGWINVLNPNVAAAIITAFVGLIGLWYAQWHTKSRTISESHRQSKIEVYNQFFDIVEKFIYDFDGELLESLKKGEKLPDDLRRDFRKLNRGLILWSGPRVIKAWTDFRIISQSGGNTLMAIDKMYQEIRKDLGVSNFGLQGGDLLKTTVSDPQNLKIE